MGKADVYGRKPGHDSEALRPCHLNDGRDRANIRASVSTNIVDDGHVERLEKPLPLCHRR